MSICFFSSAKNPKTRADHAVGPSDMPEIYGAEWRPFGCKEKTDLARLNVRNLSEKMYLVEISVSWWCRNSPRWKVVGKGSEVCDHDVGQEKQA